MTSYYDYIVVGSGIAGLYTALLAKEQGSVLLVTKGNIDDCNTKLAQGGIAAAIGHKDSPELHYRDTLSAGDGLCDKTMVRILAREAAARIADLVNFGVPFDTVDGQVALTLEAAHSLPRILHAGGDATGEHIELTLSERVHSSEIKLVENCLATRIIVEDGRAVGLETLNDRDGSRQLHRGRFIILATGGAGQLYRTTTNPEVATGDGIVIAYEAGAEIMDIEFFQFHPTALHVEGARPFLISEAVRGEGGTLRNVQGHNFMKDYSEKGDLAPRDIAARAIIFEMDKTGAEKVFLDVTHLPAGMMATRFPQIYRVCAENGIDLSRDLIPVAPAAHYTVGGVRVNSWGETTIPGLFAAGETSCTGVHGANRLASNSLLEVLVFSRRIMERTLGRSEGVAPYAGDADIVYHSLGKSIPASDGEPSLAGIQHLLWNKAGIIREQNGLAATVARLTGWRDTFVPMSRSSYELKNLISLGMMLAEAALRRRESRGAHFRTDFPRKSVAWKKHIVLKRHEEEF